MYIYTGAYATQGGSASRPPGPLPLLATGQRTLRNATLSPLMMLTYLLWPPVIEVTVKPCHSMYTKMRNLFNKIE